MHTPLGLLYLCNELNPLSYAMAIISGIIHCCENYFSDVNKATLSAFHLV